MAIFTWSWSLLFLLNALLVGSVTWIALAAWNDGRMTTAMVATAIPFVLQIMNISGWILEVGSNVFRQIGTVRDSMVTIARPLTLVDAPARQPLVVTAGEIVYDRVGFDYWRGDAGSVVSDFSLTVRPGEKIGLVGRSGAGKSTLVNLTLRMFDVASGAIRIDGQDIRDVTQQSLRQAIGVVGQDTSLLHRSVRDNIKYGRPGATDAEMVEAAKRASVHDVVEALVDPEGRRGYDAHVGERGVKLSGGQRQRIALARVILKDAPILVLDEATSALDSEVEAAIQDTLYRRDAGQDRHRHRASALYHCAHGPHRRARPRAASSRRAATPTSSPATASTPASGAASPAASSTQRGGGVTPPAFRDAASSPGAAARHARSEPRRTPLPRRPQPVARAAAPGRAAAPPRTRRLRRPTPVRRDHRHGRAADAASRSASGSGRRPSGAVAARLTAHAVAAVRAGGCVQVSSNADRSARRRQ